MLKTAPALIRFADWGVPCCEPRAEDRLQPAPHGGAVFCRHPCRDGRCDEHSAWWRVVAARRAGLAASDPALLPSVVTPEVFELPRASGTRDIPLAICEAIALHYGVPFNRDSPGLDGVSGMESEIFSAKTQ